MDLFETPEVLPANVRTLIDKFSEMDATYENCNTLVQELNKIGYTCEYGLDAIPYELKQLN
jgi:hypothetical protein